MDKQYYSIYVSFKQAIDQTYRNKDSLQKDFVTDSRALLEALHPKAIENKEELLEFNLGLLRHFIARWKKFSEKAGYDKIIVLVKKLGSLLVREEKQIPDDQVHDQEALQTMNLKVIKEKRSTLETIAIYVFIILIIRAVYFSFFYSPPTDYRIIERVESDLLKHPNPK